MTPHIHWDAQQLLLRLPTVLDPPSAISEHQFAHDTTAAVLVLLNPQEPSLPILFLERALTLKDHPGQIGFPGGRTDPGDDSPIATALREAGEEVAMPSDAATILGTLPPRLTGQSRLWMYPIIALMKHPWPIEINPAETTSWFWSPLESFLDADHQEHAVVREGTSWSVHWFTFPAATIWGATASVIVDLCDRLELVLPTSTTRRLPWSS